VFGEDGLPVDDDVEDAPGPRDDLQLLDVILVLRKDLRRQTDGFVRIRSLRAVDDVDLHV
jgi:hypothetical protein